MRIIFLMLHLVLLCGYGFTLKKILKGSCLLNPLLGWWVGLGYFVVFPLSIMVAAGKYELEAYYQMDLYWREVDFGNTSFLPSYLLIWVSMLAACLVIYIFFKPDRQTNPQSLSVGFISHVEKTLIITMVLTVLDWLMTVRLVGGFEAFLISHWYERGDDLVSQLGDSYVLLSHFSMANQAVFTAALSVYTGLALRRHKVTKKLILSGLAIALVEVVMTGNRIYLATYLIAFLISCILYSRRKLIIGLMIASPVLAIVFSAWAAVRHDLTDIPNSAGAFLEDGVGNHMVSSAFDTAEGIDVLLLMHIIRDFGTKYDYLYGESYSRSILSFIPRKLFPGKPGTFPGQLGEIYVPNVLTSLNATALGEMYANFGPFTVLVFPLFTLGVVVLNSTWKKAGVDASAIHFSLLFILMIWTARVTFEESFVLYVLGLFIMLIFRMRMTPRALQTELALPF